ncbi:MAG: PAS domain S-box protein [Spirochaetes bacterium]|nr:PAS domain S-box protein [Spirochaetota bacterium]
MNNKPDYDDLLREVSRLKNELLQKDKNETNSFVHLQKSWGMMAQNASFNIVILNRTAEIVYINKPLFQQNVDSVLGKKYMDLLDVECRNPVKTAIEKCMQTGSVEKFEIRLKVYNTENYYINTVTPSYGPNGVIGVMISVENVSPQIYIENELKNIEEQLLTLLNSSVDIISFKDTEGRWGLTNDTAEKYLRLSDVDYVMKTDKEIAELSPFFKKYFFENSLSDVIVWATGKPVISEETIPDSDDPDEILTFEIIKTPLYNADNTRRGLIINGRNVTSRKKTEEKLIESEARFKGAFLNSNVGIAILSTEGGFLDVNTAFCNIMGFNKDDIYGKDFHSYIYMEDRKEVKDHFNKLAKGIISGYQLETRFCVQDKKEIWITLSTAMLFDTKKKPLYAVVQIIDITSRKKSEIMLKESEDRYRLLANASDDAVFITEQGICLDVNDKAVEVFGYPADEFTGMYIGNLVLPDFINDLEESLFKEKETSIETVARRKDGEKFFALFQMKKYAYLDKQTILVLCRDLTKQKEYEKELIEAKIRAEESDQLKSAFLANMSHEIRTPMNGIVGFSQILKDEKLSTKRRNHIIDIVNRSSLHLLRIVNDIIDISRIETNQISLTNSPFFVNDVIEELSLFYKPLCENKGVGFVINNLENNLAIVTDRTKLHQILDNLITNSLKFTSEGQITLSLIVKDEQLVFTVSDTGVGVPDADKPLIFNRFSQADNQKHTSSGGTGLGLSISKAYAELMKGSLQFESEVDKGTTFILTLPLVKGDTALALSTVINRESGPETFPPDTKVLIVEDEEINYLYLKMILDKEDVKYIRTASGLEAVEICKNDSSINIILMDIKLPDIDGFSASSKIKQFRKNIPIIAQSAFAMQDEKTKALQSHFDDYITKPINSRELIASLKFHLKKSG